MGFNIYYRPKSSGILTECLVLNQTRYLFRPTSTQWISTFYNSLGSINKRQKIEQFYLKNVDSFEFFFYRLLKYSQRASQKCVKCRPWISFLIRKKAPPPIPPHGFCAEYTSVEIWLIIDALLYHYPLRFPETGDFYKP